MNDQYQALYQTFRWLVPTQFNIAEACCHRWASSSPDARRIAIYYEDEAGNREVWTYARLAEAANQLANGLIKMGVNRGDRVGVVLGQRPETVVAHMAIYSVGAVVLPLSALFGPEALETRLRDSETRVAIVDHASSANLLAVSDHCPALQQIIGIGFADERVLPWRSLLARQPSEFKPVPTRSSDPAILLYTSGTTGAPKGALLPHSALIGNLPGFVASQDWFPKPADVFWSPADWAWTGGMMDALLPTLYFGHPIVGTRGFSAERAFELMERYQVTNTFLFPTALKMMMKAVPDPRSHYQLALRAIMSAGESVGETVFGWCEKALGITPNEMFGQTEMNYLVGNSNKRWPAKAGSMGRPRPPRGGAGRARRARSHRRSRRGRAQPAGHPRLSRSGAVPGLLAQRGRHAGQVQGRLVPDRRPGQHRRRRLPLVCRPRGRRVQVGRLPHRPGRDRKLPARPSGRGQCGCRAQARPRARRRGEGLCGADPEFAQRDRQDIIENLQEHVRERLAPYEYPKEIEFVDELPMTTTGKILRRLLRQREADRALAASKGSACAAPIPPRAVSGDFLACRCTSSTT